MKTYRGVITSRQFAAPATGPTLPKAPTFNQQWNAISQPARQYNEQLWGAGKVFSESIDARAFE